MRAITVTDAQKRLRELRDRQSRERQRMAELSRVETLDDETRAEMDRIETGTPDLERQIRAAQTAADAEGEGETRTTEPDAEARERIELRSRASLTNFLTAALSGRQVDGAEAELRSAAGIGDGIPLELWDVPAPTEHRADAPTGAPGTVGVNLDPIRPMIFANSIAPRLGIEMPRVASGTFASATITTALTAAAKDKGGVADSTEAGFTVSTATPKRVSARLSVRIEDVAAVGQANFEASLRENLAMVLSDALDVQALSGDGNAPNLRGIFTSLTDPTDPTAVADFDAFAAAHAGGVDGLWSSTIKDVSIVCGPATYVLASKTFQSAANYKGEMSAAAYAAKETGGLWTNKRMPDAASNIQQAILHRKGRTGLRTAVCPHWGEVGIDDIYSDSAAGTRHFTMHVLLGDVILVQPDAYSQVAFKLA